MTLIEFMNNDIRIESNVVFVVMMILFLICYLSYMIALIIHKR